MNVLLMVSCIAGAFSEANESCLLGAAEFGGWVLRNDRIARRLPDPKSLPSRAEVWPIGSAGIAFKDYGFLIRLEGGTEVKPSDCVWRPEVFPGARQGRICAEYVGEATSAGLVVVIEYSVSPREPWLRKQLRLRAVRPVVLRDVQVERLRVTVPTELGGLGQPVFIDYRAFAGLEYPAAENLQHEGWVTLEHHPGTELRPGGSEWISKPAVIGIAEGLDATTAFSRYLASFRRPPKPLVVYNSWYDVQRGEMSTAVLLERARQLRQELTVKRGAFFDVVVLDDGWQNVQSIWEIDPRGFPHGFDELHQGLKAMGVRLGLWHPLTAMKYNLDTEWGAANGYEVSPDKSFFCLSGPRYNAALRDELRRHVTEYEIGYLKHDFNAFACAGAGHGHLPEAVYGREANVDAEIAMFSYLHQLDKDIYLNPSGGMWLSPWWLMHVDTVWMQHCNDFGYNKEVVAYEPRDWEMTYRDAALWQNLHGDRVQFPVSAIMTIGIIDGKLNRLGGEHEPLDRWANNVMLNMGRGSLLQELYVTPSLFSQQQWDILATALKWQRQYVRQIAQGRMLAADPRWGDVYGFAHLDSSGGFVCLRNPGIVGRTACVELPDLPAKPLFSARRTYPWLEDVQLRYTQNNWQLEVEVEPFGVTVVEIVPASTLCPPRLPGRRCSIADRQPGRIAYDVWGHPGTGGYSFGSAFPGKPYHLWDVRTIDETGRRFGVRVDQGVDWRFVVVAHGAGASRKVRTLLDGVEVEPQRVSGEGWELYTCRVPEGSHEVAWSVPDSPQQEPFASPSFWIESFFVREAKLASLRVNVPCGQTDQKPILPPTPCANIERTTWVGPKVTIEAREGPRAVPVTEQDLTHAKAAKLHIRVFGSQGGDDYGRKWIMLNQQRIAPVPVNSNPSDPDRWEDFVLDLSQQQVAALRIENDVCIQSETGDCFKFTDVALAVLLADGRWAESEHSDDIFCSAPGWLYEEGKTFRGTTPTIRLRFREAQTDRH